MMLMSSPAPAISKPQRRVSPVSVISTRPVPTRVQARPETSDNFGMRDILTKRVSGENQTVFLRATGRVVATDTAMITRLMPTGTLEPSGTYESNAPE